MLPACLPACRACTHSGGGAHRRKRAPRGDAQEEGAVLLLVGRGMLAGGVVPPTHHHRHAPLLLQLQVCAALGQDVARARSRVVERHLSLDQALLVGLSGGRRRLRCRLRLQRRLCLRLRRRLRLRRQLRGLLRRQDAASRQVLRSVSGGGSAR